MLSEQTREAYKRMPESGKRRVCERCHLMPFDMAFAFVCENPKCEECRSLTEAINDEQREPRDSGSGVAGTGSGD